VLRRVAQHPLLLLLALSYTLVLFVVGSLPGNGGLPNANDKLAHFLGFGLQTVVAFPLTRALFPDNLRASIGAAIVYGSLTGGLLELWQMLMPSRQADWWDWLADSAGAGLFGLCLFLVLRVGKLISR
jgi:VanZ family protein